MKWIDVLKGIGILLVVVGHTCNRSSLLATTIFSFHMPLFFFIAGYLFNFNKYRENITELVQSSFKRLILPYFTTGLIVYLYWLVFFSLNNIHTIIAIAQLLAESWLYGTGNVVSQFPEIEPIGPLWFLCCLFLARILFVLILKTTNRLPLTAQFILIMTITYGGCVLGKIIKLPWSFDIAISMQYFMFIGYMFKKNEVFDKINFKWLMLIALFWVYDIYCGGISVNDREYLKPLISFNGAICGIVITTYLAKYISKFNKSSIFSFFGHFSLIILSFHTMDSGHFHWDKVMPHYDYLLKHWGLLFSFRLAYSVAIAWMLQRIPVLNKIYK